MPASFEDKTKRISRQTEEFKTFWIDRSGNHPDNDFAELGGHHRQILLVFQGILQGLQLRFLLVMADSYLRRSVVLCCADKGGRSMATKRPDGDGLVRKRSDGRWEGRIIVGHKEDGKPIFRSVFAKTQKELMDKLHRSIETFRGVELTENANLTLGAWLDKWLEERMRFTVRESTLDGYRRLVKNYIKPHLGDKKIGSVTTADIQRMYNWLRENGRVNEHYEKGNALSDSSVRGIHMLLHQAMDAAVQERIIVKNPTEGTVIPKTNYAPKKILTEAQLQKFLDVVRQDAVWSDFFYTELTTGMRRGEICGLRWQDFDEKTGRLQIRRAVTGKKGGGVKVGETKTEKGTRTIQLPPSTVEILKARKKKSYSDWIFHNPTVPELPLSPQTAYRRMKTLLRYAELPSIRFHDLRHTFATHALTSGVDAKTLSGILGHTNASFTLDTYTPMTTEMQKKASGIVENFLEEIM